METDGMRRSDALPATVLALVAIALAGSAHGQGITEFPLPAGSDGQPWSITAGPDGALWFTEMFGSSDRIGRITPAGVASEFPTPPYAGPSDIVTGPDGNLWFADFFHYYGGICRMTATGDFTEFPVPTLGAHPEAIAVGPDRNLWFTETDGNRIGRITTTGDVTEFAIPTPNSTPRGIAAGPDGNLWFTEVDGNRIGRISTEGVVAEFPIPTANSHPWKIVAGRDGNMWFTENAGGKIGRISTAGLITEFPSRCGHPFSITAGPDGNLWFTAGDVPVCRMTTDGVVTRFAWDPLVSVFGIAAGPDGNIWFTEPFRRKIGRIVTGPCSGNATVLCLNGGRFQVRVTWSVPSDGLHGDGQAVSLTSDTGYFWFFSENNVEMVIKVVDGRAVNGRFWVFAGGLTDVNVVITVTDTQTGAVKTYSNPQGTAFLPIQDTGAFAGVTEGAVRASVGDAAPEAAAISADLARLLSGPWARSSTAAAFEAACTPDATTLCLNGGRFKVQTLWSSPQGQSGSGQAVSLTSDTGYFWFFSASNVEMVVKVLNACGFNSRFWTFVGGLTNVNVVMTVTDTQTGAIRTYTNPQGIPFQPIQDTSAFVTCP